MTSPDVATDDVGGTGTMHASNRLIETSWRTAKIVVKAPENGCSCHVAPIRMPCSRSLACWPVVLCHSDLSYRQRLTWGASDVVAGCGHCSAS